jgi:hypothetical protein
MNDDIELVHGSGNIFRDFNMPNPDLEQLRAILAAQIIKTLDARGLTVRRAGELTGIAAADSPASAAPIWTASPWTG